MKELIIPEGYSSKLSLLETEIAIKKLKDFFEKSLSEELNLTRVSAPFFVREESGLNDDLNGIEKAVSFSTIHEKELQVVHSLAKWKRMALYKYGFEEHTGLYTDMNAIRKDEELSNIHSLYVDQWDWEMIISREERTMEKLQEVVKRIYKVFKKTEAFIKGEYPHLTISFPEEITFISSQELEDRYPELTSKEREDKVAKEYGAVFITQIGKVLKSGEKHDGRAPDYDDWELNGDIIFWNDVLKRAFELSSMGIRVDAASLNKQLEHEEMLHRKDYPFHQLLLQDALPFTIGGGIGQSRICMFFLEKAHIGEVQSSVWPEEMAEECEKNGIKLL
ncbi:aspartate--ammonia ligase [uncultured Ilyobacter sp.]|uniref:aspartate--ammonia ligase n=1 Tax=uncultured Ilyobacter sp. TaxID=544433 RepID=UPI0029C7116C|nr:aspartate--ammonia ligase [uncultured Ilyobacter sp.]